MTLNNNIYIQMKRKEATKDIYDDFKLKNNCHHDLYKTFQSCKG